MKNVIKILNYIILVLLIISILTFNLNLVEMFLDNGSKTPINSEVFLVESTSMHKSNNRIDLFDDGTNVYFYQYADNETYPVFYNTNVPNVDIPSMREAYLINNFPVFTGVEEVKIKYNGKEDNLTNRFKKYKNYLPSNYISLNDKNETQSYGIPIFPLNNDIYAIFGASESNFSKHIATSYIDMNAYSQYGQYKTSGVAKYFLVNLTKEEPAKLIIVNVDSGKIINLHKTKLMDKLNKAGINYKACYEVGDTYQIVFDEIPNSILKKKIKSFSKYKKNKPINISIEKKDIDKFIKLLCGGDK